MRALVEEIKNLADGPVSRILCGVRPREGRLAAAIIPLGHASRRDSSSLPEGCSPQYLVAKLGRSMLRPYKDILDRGGSAFAFANLLGEPGRLSPPIWPCTTRGFPGSRYCYRDGGLLPHLFTLAKRFSFSKTSRRFPCAMPPCCFAGGIFSVALSVTEPHCVELNSTPHFKC